MDWKLDALRLSRHAQLRDGLRAASSAISQQVNTYGAVFGCSRFQARSALSSGLAAVSGRKTGFKSRDMHSLGLKSI
jgi:hypothetical protein